MDTPLQGTELVSEVNWSYWSYLISCCSLKSKVLRFLLPFLAFCSWHYRPATYPVPSGALIIQKTNLEIQRGRKFPQNALWVL